ncbi:Ig-like domain-containing protein [Blautia wexlerae]|nr:Ig-like domain-containing protein [Blautia wexlerae]
MTWTFSPQGSGGELVWTSDNVHVAKVDQKGVVTPLSVGETDIRVKTDQNVTAVCHVVVKGTAKDLFASRNADCESMQGFRKYSNDYLG